MSEFKFKIGDALMHRGQAAGRQPGDDRPATILFVLERITQECPGGLQKHYLCRVVSASGWRSENDWTATRFLEDELAPWGPSGEAEKKAATGRTEP